MKNNQFPKSPDLGTGDPSDPSDPSDQSDRTDRHRATRLRPGGGYRELRSFQAATIIYDATVSFCDRFIDKRSRTHDQMVQAARSGRQNIAEGSRAGATSSKTETRLTNVARSSLDELLLDYEDYLRQRKLRQWGKDDAETLEVRRVGRQHRIEQSDQSNDFGPYSAWLNHKDPVMVANTIICLIHQANYLLDRQIAALERNFIQEGGYSEQLAAARIEERNRQNRTDQSDRPDESLVCPLCGKLMTLRTARQGKTAGSRFWGCTAYPDCKGTRPSEEGKNKQAGPDVVG